MLTALVLVCSVGITPDLSVCTRDNALQVLRVPSEFTNPATCFLYGQAYLAQTPLGQDLGDAERVKIVCASLNPVTTIVQPGLVR
jgi:hypothetical protein